MKHTYVGRVIYKKNTNVGKTNRSTIIGKVIINIGHTKYEVEKALESVK